MTNLNDEIAVKVLKSYFGTAYEGEGDTGGGDNPPAGGGDNPPAGGGDNPNPPTQPKGGPANPHTPKKTFTQEDVDRVLKERLARESDKHREKQTELLNRLTELEKKATLTDEERSALTQRIEELRNENLSTEEKASREIKRLTEELEKTKHSLTKEANTWVQRYQDFRIDRELWDAANQNDSRTPSQLVALLKPNTQIKEIVTDGGQPTGRYEVRTTITEFKDDGTPFQVERSPMEAVARLREMPEIWGNQFNSKAISGLDLMSGQNMPVQTGGGLITDRGFEAYMASREKNKGSLGINEHRRRK